MTDRQNFPAWTDTGRRKIAAARRESEFTPALRNFAFSDYASATNGGTSVIELIGPIVIGEGCLIVTGYQDLLSALSIIMEVRPGITFEAPGSIRILFGTNTDNLRFLTGPRQPLPEHVKRHYTLQTGVFVRDTRDLRALQARDALRSGAISIRIFDEARAEKDLGRPAGMMHANLFLNDEFAVAGSANFSRHGMASNIEFADRAMAGTAPAHEERRKAGETFWSWGVDWNDETLEILDRLLRDVSPKEALGRALDELTGFQAWRPASSEMGPEHEDLVYAAAQSVYEHGLALLAVPAGAQRSLIGRAVGSLIADMYERCVMRDDGASARRQGALALVNPAAEEAWRRGRRGALRILPANSEKGLIASEVDAVAAIVLEEGEQGTGRPLAAEEPKHLLPAGGAHWTAAMLPPLPSGLSVEPALDLVETAGGPAMSDELAAALIRAGNPLFPGRTGKRPKKSAAKQEEAQADLAAMLSPLRATLKGKSLSPEHSAIRVRPTTAVRAQLDRIKDCLTEILSADAEAAASRQAARDLVAGLATSVEAARNAWDSNLASRLGVGSEPSAANQGMLPMFALAGEKPTSDAVEQLRSALFSRDLDGLDRFRLEKLLGDCAAPGKVAIVAESAKDAEVLAVAVGEVDDRPSMYLCPRGQAKTTSEHCDLVVAAGETIGHRSALRGNARDARDFLEGSSEGAVLVLERKDLACLDLSRLDTLWLLSATPDLKSMAALTSFIADRQTRSGSPSLKCLVLEGLPLAASGAALDRSFKAATMAGTEGRFGVELVCPAAVLRCMSEMVGETHNGHLLDEIEAMRQLVGRSNGARDVRGAELTVLRGVPTPFTAYVLAGKTGRRGEPFMPPRLLVVKQGEEGDELIRGQIPALALLRSAFSTVGSSNSSEAGGARDETLETISRHLAHITHWDVRPERVRALLSSLAGFMDGAPMECDGASVLGDLTLPSLELVADRWASHLAPVAARLRASAEEKRQKKGLHDPLLDISQVERAIRDRPSWEVDGIKADMAELIEDLRFADREKVKTIQDRVVVVIRALP